jgi:hypothetical protein
MNASSIKRDDFGSGHKLAAVSGFKALGGTEREPGGTYPNP